VCVTRERRCEDCLLYRSCIYPYVFETPPPPGAAKMRRYTAAPHPFVLAPMDGDATGRTLGVGTPLALGLTLFGRANAYLPYFVHALQRAGEKGLGKGRGRLVLAAVEQEAACGSADWRTVYESEDRLRPLGAQTPPIPLPPRGVSTLTFATPLRLRREGHNVPSHDLRFSDLFGSLLRRISMLTYFHTDTPLETDFAGLVRESTRLPLTEADVRWREWSRYSSRQQTRMQMGGITGTVQVDLTGHDGLWPYLWLGQWTHVGKGTSMGLGRYAIDMPASLPARTPEAAACET
jgi:hypothetical protein